MLRVLRTMTELALKAAPKGVYSPIFAESEAVLLTSSNSDKHFVCQGLHQRGRGEVLGCAMAQLARRGRGTMQGAGKGKGEGVGKGEG